MARFIESLGAKVHSSPPSIEKIAGLFQEFYARAELHIATHISTLASRIHREVSPRTRESSQQNQKDGTARSVKVATDHQMLTASEVTERRKARKLLGYKRVALEEAVERRACESVYDKIWRHRNTLDEVRDEKLRSKTAALSVIGIGLKDLGVEFPALDGTEEAKAHQWLSDARKSLVKINDEKYPLGKLQHLIAAHKAVVDALTNLIPSSSSADEILPTLIYSLVTSPPEGINAVSNLLFIQRFRSANKVDGEAAYVLTNLEAAICFLENVDLSSLSAEDSSNCQPKRLSSLPAPSIQHVNNLSGDTLVSSLNATSASPEFSRPLNTSKDIPSTTTAALPVTQISAPSAQQRRLSNLFQPPSKVFGAANDVVRNTADQGLRNIGNTLDNSFNFLFRRLKEVQSTQRSDADNQHTVAPKTLDEARRLVANPTLLHDNNLESEISSKGAETADGSTERSNTLKIEDKRRNLVDERHGSRDRSVDSAKSNDSGRRHTNALRLSSQRDQATPSPSASSSSIFATHPASTPLESMKNFGNTFNPLNHIPGMIRGFGRNVPETLGRTSSPAPAPAPSLVSVPVERLKSAPTASDGTSDGQSIITAKEVAPPIKRFLEVQDVNDLKLGEITELLADYQRLAATLGNLAQWARRNEGIEFHDWKIDVGFDY
jgi:Vacuolar sorting protein 9 (VPS9) domain